jgi:shikimate kinase
MNIILIGFKNCGKTSIGKLVAEKIKAPFVDTDHLLEQHYYKHEKSLLTAREISQKNGEQYFRDLEKNIIANLHKVSNTIIATGGGSIFAADNLGHLKKLGKIVYLCSSFETLLKRLLAQPTPAFLDARQPEQSFRELYEKRKNIYKQAADIELSTDNKSISKLAEEIIFLMRNSNGQ